MEKSLHLRRVHTFHPIERQTRRLNNELIGAMTQGLNVIKRPGWVVRVLISTWESVRGHLSTLHFLSTEQKVSSDGEIVDNRSSVGQHTPFAPAASEGFRSV
jgi:hypothetical protein